MAYLLRKFSYAKWNSNRGLPSADFSADSITNCIKTSKNQLSTWISDSNDFNNDEVEKLVVALATNMERPDVIDVIWLDPIWLEENGISLECNLGESKYGAVNEKHRDISMLSLSGLGLVGEHIIKQMETIGNYKRFTKKEVMNLVVKWQAEDNEFQLSDLSERWSEPLQKIIRN